MINVVLGAMYRSATMGRVVVLPTSDTSELRHARELAGADADRVTHTGDGFLEYSGSDRYGRWTVQISNRG